jgi:hypothetical protein
MRRVARQVHAFKVGEDGQRRAEPVQLAGLGERGGCRLGGHHRGEHVRRSQVGHDLVAVR